MALVSGICNAKFAFVRDVMQEKLSAGEELGLSFSVNISGRTVVDLHGGYTSPDNTSPWTSSTVAPVFSSTKNVVSLAVLHLASQGRISLNDKVSKYWPDFACAGKEDVEIRHLISHTSGVPGWIDDVTFEDLCDTEKSTAKLAEQKVCWEPGTEGGYHCWSFGHLAGTVIHRITGLSLTQYIATEIAGPRNATFSIGCSESQWGNIAELVPPPVFTNTDWVVPEKGSMPAMLMNPLASAELANSGAWRRGEVAAVNGFTNARGLVDLLSAVTLAGSQSGDTLSSLLDEETRDAVFEEQFRGKDLLLGVDVRYGIGYALRGEDGDGGLEGPVEKTVPKGKVAYWGGWGGSMVVMDVEREVTCAFVGNRMTNEGVGWVPFVKEVYRVLGVGGEGERDSVA